MRWYFVIAALAVLAAAAALLVPPAGVSKDAAVALAAASPDVQFFKSLYPDAVQSVEERGCLADFFRVYVSDVSGPLFARTKPSCSEKDTDVLVSYSATNISDTGSVYVGVDDDTLDGNVTHSGFISPYDDVYVLNYSFTTLQSVMDKVLEKNNLTVAGGQTILFMGGTKYHVFTLPQDGSTVVLLYVEQTPEYKLATKENLRSEMDAAHAKFRAGGEKLTEFMRDGFIGNWTVTTHYLYYPEPE